MRIFYQVFIVCDPTIDLKLTTFGNYTHSIKFNNILIYEAR